MKLLVTMFLFLTTAALHSEESWTIHAHGYGPLSVGMSVKQAEKILATELALEESPLVEECFIGRPRRGHSGLYLMIEAGKVTHVGTSANGIASDKGIRVGDSAADVKRAYAGSLDIQPHYYEDNAFYFFAWERRDTFGVEYEINAQGKVVEIRGGDESIQLAEGPCA